MKIKQILILIIFFLLSFFVINKSAFAQTDMQKQETLEARIEKILEEKQIKPMGAQNLQLYQKLELFITKGSLKNKKIIIESGDLPLANLQRYYQGDKVVVSYSKDFKGNDSFYISDFIRRDSLMWLFIIFVILTIYIAKWRGLMSLIGMTCSFFIIFLYILPNISAGLDPIQITIAGSLFIIPITFS